MLRLYEVSVDRNALVRNMDLNIERQIIEKDNDNTNKNKEEKKEKDNNAKENCGNQKSY